MNRLALLGLLFAELSHLELAIYNCFLLLVRCGLRARQFRVKNVSIPEAQGLD